MQKNYDNNINRPIVIKEKKSNGIGTAGFVLALIALFLGWIPYLGWILWVLGFVFSIIGMFKKPRGLAITGFILSIIDVLVLIFLIGSLLTSLSF